MKNRNSGAVRGALLLGICMAAFAVSSQEPLPGDSPLSEFPENADIRKAAWDTFVTAGKSVLRSFRPREATNENATWQLSVIRKNGFLYQLMLPRRGSSFAQYAQGAWIVKRSDADGSWLQAKIFLRSDPGVFVRVYPFKDRAKLDVVAYGAVLHKEAIVPVPFETVLRSPVSALVAWTSAVVDWSLFDVHPGLYDDNRRLVAAIRARLGKLRFAADGALDENGEPVLIATGAPQAGPPGLNCSGFVKWLVDGLLRPLSGEWLAIGPLKERSLELRGSSFTESFEASRDPFFGIDWGRALAQAMDRVLYPGSASADDPKSHDVNDLPFALVVKSSDPINGGSLYEPFSGNFETAGFGIRGLEPMLFILAMHDPGRFYIAEFNARLGSVLQLRQYFHSSALFPYFDERGIFRVAVFESAAETSLERIEKDPNYEFVKLVRLPVLPGFDPPELPEAAD